jgi:hypothetical protein
MRFLRCLVFVSLLSPIQASDDFWKTWGDGKAELTTYQLTTPRYGELRKGKAVLIFVTEDHSLQERVKIEGDTTATPSSQKIPILKLNAVRDFQTGIYPYHILTSVFARIDRPQTISKISFSAQEWCGHTYHQLIQKGMTLHETVHSYFGGEADQTKRWSIPPDVIYEDAFPILVRELQGEWLKPGEKRVLPLAPSLMFLRLNHKPFAWQQVTIEKSALLMKLPSPLKEPRSGYRWTLTTPQTTWTYWVENNSPHRILGWQNTLGEIGSIRESKRLPYWALHENGDETQLSF